MVTQCSGDGGPEKGPGLVLRLLKARPDCCGEGHPGATWIHPSRSIRPAIIGEMKACRLVASARGRNSQDQAIARREGTGHGRWCEKTAHQPPEKRQGRQAGSG